MKIDGTEPAMPLGLAPDGSSYSRVDILHLEGMEALIGMNILTVIASQQMAALTGTLSESSNITEELASHIAKEAVILAKSLINEINNQDNGK